jgi:hypothetical protein
MRDSNQKEMRSSKYLYVVNIAHDVHVFVPVPLLKSKLHAAHSKFSGMSGVDRDANLLVRRLKAALERGLQLSKRCRMLGSRF